MTARGTTFRLIRHGSTEGPSDFLAGRTSAVGLSAEGRRQAERMAGWLRDRLAPEGVVGVYTSPVRRARATAEPIARAFELEAVPADGLSEVDFGRWEGRSFADLESEVAWRRWNRFRAGAQPRTARRWSTCKRAPWPSFSASASAIPEHRWSWSAMPPCSGR